MADLEDVLFEDEDDAEVEAALAELSEEEDVEYEYVYVDEDGNELTEEEVAQPDDASAEPGEEDAVVELGDDDEEVEYVYVDEDGNEIPADQLNDVDIVEELGDEEQYVYVDEDGNEVVLSEEELEGYEIVSDDDDSDNPLAYDKVQRATDDLNSIAREGIAMGKELKETVDDFKSLFDFKSMFK